MAIYGPWKPGMPYDPRVCGGGYGITGRGPFTSAESFRRFDHSKTELLGAFSDDARHAIQSAPDYFVWWYTVKSVGLGVAFAALAFMIGRASCKR